jgi:Tol biopolymer transport system component
MQQVTHSGVNEFDPAISPDGKSIAYDVAPTEDATPHVEVLSLADRHVEYSSKETPGLEPTWMPDGSGLVFVSKTRGSVRGIVQTMGQGPARTNFLADAGDPQAITAWPAVAPNGQTVAISLANLKVFESGWRWTKDFDRAIGLTDLLGTGTTVLGAGTDPSWSPDGRRIAFARATRGHAHLFVANADGTDELQITEGSSDDLEPSWSPDGKLLVFCSAHGVDRWTQANLFAVRPDGQGLVQLTEGDRMSCRPTWAKDGWVYFHANATDRFHIWRVRPVGPAEAHVD